MATPTIKAIETEYAGCRFRSRLEARWAVFFDHLGIPWAYEDQGYLIDGHRYLPDFHLHGWFVPEGEGQGLTVEVKGVLTAEDLKKMLLLTLTGKSVLLLQDIPREGRRGPHFWLFQRVLGKGPSIGIEGLRVGFYQGSTSGWAIYPFSWPMRIDKYLDGHMDTLIDDMEAIADQKGTGWVQIPRQVQTAYRAARQARFEHGESGR